VRNAFLKLGVACLFLLGIARPAPAQAPKIQVLIITGQNGHDWRATTPVLRKMLEDTKRFEVRVIEEFRGGGPETLAPYDLVVLNYYDGNKPALRWGARADNALWTMSAAARAGGVPLPPRHLTAGASSNKLGATGGPTATITGAP
jgi:phospholipase/lecithinase/hemolysin